MTHNKISPLPQQVFIQSLCHFKGKLQKLERTKLSIKIKMPLGKKIDKETEGQ